MLLDVKGSVLREVKSILIYLFALFFSSISLAGVSPVILEEGKDYYKSGLHLYFLKDSSGNLTIEDVNSEEWSSKFKKNKKKVPRFGFTTATIWLKVKIINNSPGKNWLFNIALSTLDKVTFFKKEKNRWVKTFGGDTLSSDQWEIRYKDIIFSLSKNRESTYFFKIKNRGGTNVPISIMSKKYFLSYKQNYDLFYGGYFMVLTIMFFYNLVIGIHLRSETYMLFVGYLFSWTLMSLAITGFGRYIVTDRIIFSNEGMSFFVVCTIVFFLLFIRKFLEIEKKNYMLNSFFHYFFLTLCCFVPFTIFLNLRYSLFIIAIVGAGCGLLSLSTFIYFFKKSRSARIATYSFSVVLLGALFKVLSGTGVTPLTFFSEQGIFIGSLVQLIFLSLGLADRINQLQKEVLEASDEKRKFQENYAKNLEEQVTKKTQQIQIEKQCIEKLVDQTYEQKKARDQLLGSLNQGYLTFNRDGVIDEGATKVTEDLLEMSLFESEVEGIKIWDTLFKEEEKIDNFKKWVDKVFEGRFSFKDLSALAPNTFEGTKGKHIQLEYRPIYKGDVKKRNIDKIILIASDRTQEIYLEKKLELDKENVELITSCLKNPVEFVDLIDDSYELLEIYPNVKNADKGELFRKFHTLKARYGQFGVKTITYFINEVETGISKGEIDDLDSKVSRLDRELQEFVKNNRLIIEAANKFMVDDGQAVQVSEVIEKIKKSNSLDDLKFDLYKNYLLSDIKEKFERYKYLVDEIAAHQGKAIEVKILGDKVLVEYSQFSNFVAVSIHLFRNMVDHGIESEDERIEKTKPQRGCIKVEFQNNGDSFIINMEDDGRGIDPKIIKKKVLENGLKSEEEIQNLKDPECLDMIFLPGFSTKEEVTDLSGRGVGMDAVRAEVNSLGGTISISSKVDEGTKFVIKLPVQG